MSEKRFTKTVPTVSGYYWLRNWCLDDAACYYDGEPQVAKVTRYDHNGRATVLDADDTVSFWLDRLYQGEWKGPIRP